MSSIQSALAAVQGGERLPSDEVRDLVVRVLGGDSEPVLLGAFLSSLAQRGEASEEIAGVALALRDTMTVFEHGEANAIDTCGTGGDGLGTFNLSTAAAFIAAAAGAKVVKHGNRSVSSRSGSADVLEALGGSLEVGDDVARDALGKVGFTFLFAPKFHPAMRHVGPIRRTLGIRTVFNLVGPLANPGRVTRQVIGVPSTLLQDRIAAAVRGLGVTAAFVVHGDGGADELTLGPGNRVLSVTGDGEPVPVGGFGPQALGLGVQPTSSLGGGDAQENARLMWSPRGGTPGALGDAAALNAAAALVVAEVAPDAAAGLALAQEALRSGAALGALDDWVRITSASVSPANGRLS